jgi:hypothetical protein
MSTPKRVEIEVSTSSRGIIQQLNAKHGTGSSCPLQADSGLASSKWPRLAEPAGAEYYGTQQEQRKLNPPKIDTNPAPFQKDWGQRRCSEAECASPEGRYRIWREPAS